MCSSLGLGCRYFFIARNHDFSAHVFVLMSLGTLAYAFGMPPMMTRLHSRALAGRLLKALVGTIGIATIILSAKSSWKVLVAPVPFRFDWAGLAAMIGISGIIGGLGLFYVDRSNQAR